MRNPIADLPAKVELLDRLDNLDTMIREGRSASARHFLCKNLSALSKRSDSEKRVRLASLARRAGAPEISLRVLRPAVRPSHRKARKATGLEKSEYAAALIAVGAVREALTLLQGLSSDEVPQALLYQAFALFTQWNYSAAVPALKKYIASPALSDYERTVGKVNLAAALVSDDRPDARNFLQLLRGETRDRGFLRLHSNALELSAQNSVFHQRWKDASQYLAEAEKLQTDPASPDAFFAQKWKTIVSLLSAPSASSRRAFENFRIRAKKFGHAETLRECDLFSLIANPDDRRFAHLYYGTPFTKYRERIMKLLPTKPSLPPVYDWHSDVPEGSPTDRARSLIDLTSPAAILKIGLKPNQLLHRLLLLLTSDFYRPFALAEIHSELFPSEHFHPYFSPAKTHQLILRLREWIESRELPLEVQESARNYRLNLLPGATVRVHPDRVTQVRAADMDLLLEKLADRSLSASQLASDVGIPLRTMNRVLAKALDSGAVKRMGKGPLTRYEVLKTG